MLCVCVCVCVCVCLFELLYFIVLLTSSTISCSIIVAFLTTKLKKYFKFQIPES